MVPIRVILNLLLSKYDRVQVLIVGISIVQSTKLLLKLLRLLSKPSQLKDMIVCFFLRIFRKLPSVHAEIEKQKANARKSIETSILLVDSLPSISSLPSEGTSISKMKEILDEKSRLEKKKWMNGNLTGAVYNTNDELAQVQAYALTNFLKANLLHPDIFVHTRQMEAEVIRMSLTLFSGDENACGSITSGGTESILLAIKAYRDYGKSERNIVRPNMVVPSTAHAAFVKGSEYFGIELRKARCVPEKFYEVDLDHMRRLTDSNTIMLVASAPQYPHGTMDPVPAIAELALSRNIPCHVDACLGSFLLPFLKPLLPYSFDFAVPGVTSISCDTHKYGYAPKGTSVLMFRTPALRRHQYSVCSDWAGGLYATPTIAGSRNSGPVAAAWATMIYMGSALYEKNALEIHSAAKKLSDFISKRIPQLVILGRTDTSVVSFGSASTINILDIAEWMKRETKRKWTLAILQNPQGVHFAVTMANISNCDEFAVDLLAAVEFETKRIADGGVPGNTESAAIYGSAASVPKTLVDELVVDYLDTCYSIKRITH